jgi:hypothetical protein
MTSSPTLLGTGGHSVGLGDYSSSDSYYGNVGLGRCAMLGTFLAESDVSQTIRVPGTISYLSWGVDADFLTTLTLTLRHNSLNSNLVVSIGEMVSGFVTDSTHSVCVSSGDTLDFVTNLAADRNDYDGGFYCVSARFDATTDSAQMLTTVGRASISPSTTFLFVNFLGIVGSGLEEVGGSETESLQQFQNLTEGTWQNMACYIDNNNFNESTTVTNRVNYNNGSMSFCIPATYTGYFEDTTDGDVIYVDDLLDYGFLASATGNTDSFSLDWIGAHFLASTTSRCMIGGSEGLTTTISDSETDNYCSLFGGGLIGTDLTRATGLFPYALEASNFTNLVTDVEDAGSATFTLLKNGSATGLAVSSDGGTGYFTDNPTTGPNFDVGDTCTNMIILTAGTSVTLANGGLLLKAT